MKIKFCHNNHANIHSRVSNTLDVEKDLRMTPQEWTDLSDNFKMDIVKEWALEQFDYWYEECEE